MRKRQCQRYTKRLETTFKSGVFSFKGLSSNISAGGLFIRTSHSFAPGTIVDIEIFLPGNRVSRLKGIVRRAIKTTMPGVKNGMGIELIERDANYLEFLRTIVMEEESSDESGDSQENNGLEEKVNNEGTKERIDNFKGIEPQDYIIVICNNCNVKNKVPVSRRSGLKCGKCGSPLNIEPTY